MGTDSSNRSMGSDHMRIRTATSVRGYMPHSTLHGSIWARHGSGATMRDDTRRDAKGDAQR
jgi:hypothetical protein